MAGDRFDLAVGGVRESCLDGTSARADRSDIRSGGPMHRGELPADVGGRTVGAVERDGVNNAVDVRVPRRDLVGRDGAEAENVVPRIRGAGLRDQGEAADRVHGLAALDQLAYLLGRAGRR